MVLINRLSTTSGSDYVRTERLFKAGGSQLNTIEVYQAMVYVYRSIIGENAVSSSFRGTDQIKTVPCIQAG